ncbi:myelin P2 protein-like [Pyxicephalus adspersus]|uniref:myelin P2 protein-like n=1 Tax=Pyxicephalus adspersus TaxID=30357 RepID=UPI003B58E279
MAELLGCWKLIESDRFDEYMKEVGVPVVTRTVAKTLKPDVTITRDGDVWCIKTESTFKNTNLQFELNKLFKETTADGRECETIITLEDGKLIQNQKWGGRESTITREVKDGKMITICRIDKVESRRVYEKK